MPDYFYIKQNSLTEKGQWKEAPSAGTNYAFTRNSLNEAGSWEEILLTSGAATGSSFFTLGIPTTIELDILDYPNFVPDANSPTNYIGSYVPPAGANYISYMISGGGAGGTQGDTWYRADQFAWNHYSAHGGCGAFAWVVNVKLSEALSKSSISADGSTIPYQIGYGGINNNPVGQDGGFTQFGFSGGLGKFGGGFSTSGLFWQGNNSGDYRNGIFSENDIFCSGIPGEITIDPSTELSTFTDTSWVIREKFYSNHNAGSGWENWSPSKPCRICYRTYFNNSSTNQYRYYEQYISTGQPSHVSWIASVPNPRSWASNADPDIDLSRRPSIGWGYGGQGNFGWHENNTAPDDTYLQNGFTWNQYFGAPGGTGVIIVWAHTEPFYGINNGTNGFILNDPL